MLDFVENYRKLTRVPKPVFQSINAKNFLSTIGILMREELSRKSIHFAIDLAKENLELNIDPVLIEQVLINLIRNSINALEDSIKKQIKINVYSEDHSVIVEVSDTGKGIPDKEMKEIFVPFFSTKKDGSGIGLSLSKQIMAMHGGRIRVSSIVNEGTSFYLHFIK